MPAESSTTASGISFHDELAEQWDDNYKKKSFRSRLDVLESLLGASDFARQRWLDAGCGSGFFSRWAARHGAEVVGVDGARQMIDVARRLSPADENLNVAYHQVPTVEELPFSSGEFDGALCLSVLEYVNDPARALHELARVVRPGGRLVVSVPNRTSLFVKGTRIAYAITRRLGRPWPPFLAHSRHAWRRPEFEKLLAECGFQPEQHRVLPAFFPGAFGRSPLVGPLWAFAARRV